MRWSSSAVGCGAGYLKEHVLEEVNLFQISTSSSVVIDGVIEPAFREFNAKFPELGEKQQNIVLIRCALRSFLNPNLNSDRDLSSDLLLPVCKLLIQSVVSTNDQETFGKSLIGKTVQRRPKNVNGFIFSSGAYLSAKVLGSQEEAKSETIEKIAVDFATAARTRQDSTSLTPVPLEKDAYRTVAREFASEALRDSLNAGRDIFGEPLWATSDKWRKKLENQPAFKGFFYDESFAFWRKWYQGFVDGKPVDMELQGRVALIPDGIWDAGPKAVAEKIREIEQAVAGPAPLEDAALRKHVEFLLKNPVLSEATALNGAETIERAISDYLREAPANCLPEDLKQLEALPHHFRAIARVIGSQTRKEAKEPKFADEISKLHARVADLEKELAAAKSKELKGVISLKAAESFGKTIGSPVFWSGSAMSVAYFFGVSPSDMTFENLREYVGELWRANSEAPVPSNPSLPSSLDV